MVTKLLKKLGKKSCENSDHLKRMVEYADLLGRKIGLEAEQLIELWLLANLHDIGEVKISQDILIKTSNLNNQEWEKIKKHPETGYKITKSITEFSSAADKILHHHEHWDGSGYPEGLKGKEIPLLSRIIAVVDAYEIMISERPYSPAISKEKALTELKECAGSQFDPYLVEKFTEVIKYINPNL